MRDEISRRSFLRVTATAGVVLGVGDAALGVAAPPDVSPTRVDRPMR